MLDKNDLQAIGELMDVKLAAQKTEIMSDVSELMDVKLAAQKTEIMSDVSGMFKQQKTDIMHEVNVLMESKYDPRFNLLAEGQESILEKLVPRTRVDDLEEEVRFLKSIVRQMNEDLQMLKKAN